MLADVFQSFGSAVQFRHGERVYVKLRDLVTRSNQPDELSLGGSHRRIGHHIKQADMQLANVLLQRSLSR
jgi:hypothetical protein